MGQVVLSLPHVADTPLKIRRGRETRGTDDPDVRIAGEGERIAGGLLE